MLLLANCVFLVSAVLGVWRRRVSRDDLPSRLDVPIAVADVATLLVIGALGVRFWSSGVHTRASSVFEMWGVLAWAVVQARIAMSGFRVSSAVERKMRARRLTATGLVVLLLAPVGVEVGLYLTALGLLGFATWLQFASLREIY